MRKKSKRISLKEKLFPQVKGKKFSTKIDAFVYYNFHVMIHNLYFFLKHRMIFDEKNSIVKKPSSTQNYMNYDESTLMVK